MNAVIPLERADSGERPISLGSIGLSFRRYKWTFLSIFGFCFGCSLLAILTADRQYVATAQVSVSSGRAELMPDPATTKPPAPMNELVDSEVEFIRSRSVADTVISELKLQDDHEFVGSKVPGHNGEAALYEALARRLDVRRVDLTNVINIRFRSADPAKAARIANAFAGAYLSQQLASKVSETQDANGWLRQSIARLREQMLGASAAVENYRRAHNLLSANGTTLTEQQISELNQETTLARVQSAEADARRDAAQTRLRQSGSSDAVNESLQSPVVQQLRQQSADLSRQLADLTTRYGVNYPTVANLRHQLDDVNRSIAAENERITTVLEAQSAIARQRRGTVDAAASALRARLAANNAASVKLQELMYNAEALRNQYEAMLARYNQTSIRAATERPDAQIVSTALAPLLPTSPNIPLLLAFGSIQGILLGSAGVLLRRVMDKGLLSAREAEDRLGIPALAAIPQLTREQRASAGSQLILSRRHSPYTEGLRSLWVSLQNGRGSSGTAGRSILFTSALPGEGKTTLVVSLARLLALDGARVLLIDLDLRVRGASSLLGSEDVGVGALLTGQREFHSIVCHEGASGLDYIPVGTTDQSFEPSESALAALLTAAVERYAIVLIDGPPVLPVAWCRVLARHAREVAVIVRWRKTPAEIARTTLQMLADAKAIVQGVVLTAVDAKFGSATGLGDPARYQKLFQGYYSD